jgi:hypothetical protein
MAGKGTISQISYESKNGDEMVIELQEGDFLA